MPMLLASVAMITSAQPSSAALPAKQRPCTMPTTGTLPDSARELAEGVVVQARDDGHVDVAGPAAAAFGEQHDRQPELVRQPSMRSVLWWLRMPCVPASTV